MLAATFVVGGAFRIIVALVECFPSWGWVLAKGILTLLLGIAIWQQWPASGLWVIFPPALDPNRATRRWGLAHVGPGGEQTGKVDARSSSAKRPRVGPLGRNGFLWFYTTPVWANRPRPIFWKRASLPFCVISRIRAECSVAEGV
jgi:hypothetical protein